jgi:hypothetical protein
MLDNPGKKNGQHSLQKTLTSESHSFFVRQRNYALFGGSIKGNKGKFAWS